MSEEFEPDTTRPMPAGLDVYKPAERLIYRYFDGEKERVADPLVLYRRVMARAPELDADLKAAAFPGFHKADEAAASADAKLRKVFGVKPLEEGGLTPTEMEQLLDHFLTYCDWVKKNSSPTWTYAMGTSPSTGSSSGGSQPTPNTSGSGSTATAPATGGPTPTPSGQGSPPDESTQAWSIGGT